RLVCAPDLSRELPERRAMCGEDVTHLLLLLGREIEIPEERGEHTPRAEHHSAVSAGPVHSLSHRAGGACCETRGQRRDADDSDSHDPVLLSFYGHCSSSPSHLPSRTSSTPPTSPRPTP